MKKKLLMLTIMMVVSFSIVGCGGKNKVDENVVSEAAGADVSQNAVEENAEVESMDAKATEAPADIEEETADGQEQNEDEEEVEVDESEEESLPITIPYSSEVPFDLDEYPDLAAVGNYTQDDVDHNMERISDLSLALYDREEDTHYTTSVMQEYIIDSDDETRIVYASVAKGDENLDAIVKKVGYQEYDVAYYYSYDVWRDFDEMHNVPLIAFFTADGNGYWYYFANNQLILRSAGEGDSINPKTNDFINGIYKLGCYYGDVMSGEDNKIQLYLLSSDQVKEENGTYLFYSGYEEDDSDIYVLDENTIFSDDCETVFFGGYESGDTPLTWCKRAYEQEDGSTDLMGVFEMIVNDGHIDELCGSYWWD